MRAVELLLCWVCWCVSVASGAEVDFVQACVGHTAADAECIDLFAVAGAEFGAQLSRVSPQQQADPPLPLLAATPSQDCMAVELDQRMNASAAFALLIPRDGHCSFAQTTAAAERAGAALIIVRDTVDGAMASAQSAGSAAFDCGSGSALVSVNASSFSASTHADGEALACYSSLLCMSATCVPTGQHKQHMNEICCLRNALVRMIGGDSTEAAQNVSAVFMSYRDATALESMMVNGVLHVFVRAFNSEENPWNVSMFLTWILGVLIVVGAAYHSCSKERQFSYQSVGKALVALDHASPRGDDSGYVSIDDQEQPAWTTQGGDRDEERIELTTMHAVYFLVGASSMLLLVYYGHIILFVQVLFAVGTAAAIAQLVTVPLCLKFCPVDASWAVPLGGVWAFLVSSLWFAERDSGNVWPLQDAMCVALVFVFIDTIHLPSLRVGACLLCVAFFYDVFFVYFSPLVFGSNVMVDVASGGGNVRLKGADYCERYPQASECHHQSMPMVLTIPLLFSFYGGNALLGLGDIIIPGLLVSFCMRYDYCMAYPLSRMYFCVASVSYGVSLLLANVMAIVLRDVVAGQPALMYIVPIMLVSVIGFAFWRGELQEMWNGPSCLSMEQLPSPRSRDDVREREPILKKA
ncbi:TPA: hypothetical protein N0F65_005524 [Lagenidium giganteum]|uniref:PA domain-containing protein n=1 Tax=Lagenidium giganteum TaxID=4803 RepID=A0AAV2YIM7_9STRA|nr:TPA: hypothetical protein N0F65_005524 [Lagenidium giganteum]